MAKNKKASKTKTSLAHQFGGFASLLNNTSGTFKIGPKELRNLSRANPFVAVAINKIKQKLTKKKWVISPKDPKSTENLDVYIDYIKRLLEEPNQQDDTYRTLIAKMLDDLLVFDDGIIEKVRNQRGEVMELYHVDGSTIKEERDSQGYFQSPAFKQFLPSNLGGIPDAVFEQQDIMKFQANPQGGENIGKGYSPVEMVISSVVSGIRAMLYNTSYFSEGALPPAMINLKGVESEEVVAFKNAFESQLQGNPHANAYTNAETIDVKLLRPSNQEMQFYELNLWLARIVISAFDLSPQDFGLTMDVNRSTADSQSEITSSGIENYQDIIEEEINMDLIQDLAQVNPKFGLLEFKFEKPQNLDDMKKQVDIDEKHIKIGTRDPNELRVRDGLDKLEVKKEEPIAAKKEVISKSHLHELYG